MMKHRLSCQRSSASTKALRQKQACCGQRLEEKAGAGGWGAKGPLSHVALALFPTLTMRLGSPLGFPSWYSLLIHEF